MNVIKKYGWFSEKQKKIDCISKGFFSSIYWETPSGNVVEITIINTDEFDSGTNFDDIILVGEVSKFFRCYEY